MLHFFAALAVSAAAAGPSPAELSAYRGQIKSACDLSIKDPQTKVPPGFCACFAAATAAEAIALRPEERSIFLLLTENAGDPVGAQRAAQTRLSVPVERFAAAWDKLNPIGQKAGANCAKPK